jgi:hypothetical protein
MTSPHRPNASKPPSVAFRRIGASHFRLEPVTSTRLPFVADVDCIECGCSFAIRHGAVAAVFRIGGEVVAVCCDDCLSDESRARLQQLRDEVTR